MSFNVLYKGDRSIAIEYFRQDRDGNKYYRNKRKLLKWAMSIKVGDYIATCEGCNRKVTEIEPEYVELETYLDEESDLGRLVFGERVEPTGTLVLDEVRFTDTNGRWHHCPGGGCAYPAETPEQVTKYFTDWAVDPGREKQIRHWWGEKPENAERLQQELDSWQQMLRAITAGAPIVDEHGELLPEFDKN